MADRELPQAPSFSLNGLIRYDFDMSSGRMSAQFDGKYDSSYYFTVLNAPVDYQPRRFVGNARVGYTTADDRYDLAFFVRNVFDKQYRVYNLDLSALGYNQNQIAPPRTWGVSLTVNL